MAVGGTGVGVGVGGTGVGVLVGGTGVVVRVGGTGVGVAVGSACARPHPASNSTDSAKTMNCRTNLLLIIAVLLSLFEAVALLTETASQSYVLLPVYQR